MYKGSLWLDFENDHEEEHLSAKISRCIIRGDEIIFEFSGINEGCHYSGSCKLLKNDAAYYGVGIFKYADDREVSSIVEASLQINGSEVSLHGTWKDEGDQESYELEAELKV